MKALVGAFNQEKALVGAFSVITNLRMELFQALVWTVQAKNYDNLWDVHVRRSVLCQILDEWVR